ncbi:MAG TPA: arsenite methyltransferase [Kofleriaceae bacterium]|nr:arsenite methyltransferase [Kofleriaceae bacterium]
MKPDEIRSIVRDHYGAIARGRATGTSTAGCCMRSDAQASTPGCCDTQDALTQDPETLGYRGDEPAPDGANLGLGCGNPTVIASLRPGERVLDLGSGGGFDCFIAAHQVGETGRVIGVDMTADMVSLARANARKVNATNVEFRLGEIEHLPVADSSIDVILSNCVINLSPDKRAVFAEAMRVLAPGGRLAIADIVATRAIPTQMQNDVAALCGCVAGAALLDDVRAMLVDVGFGDVEVSVTPRSAEILGGWMPGIDQYVASATIEARKPGAMHARAGGATSATAGEPAKQRSCCGPECCA